MEFITFSLGGEQYALESRFTFEVFHLNDFSRIPGAQGIVFGITVWRGELLTLLDIRSTLGLQPTTLNDLTRVIVLGDAQPEFGMLADRVHDMRTINSGDIEPATNRSPHGERTYLQGITKDAVLVLDAEQLLTLHG